jgi:hypothetical protein
VVASNAAQGLAVSGFRFPVGGWRLLNLRLYHHAYGRVLYLLLLNSMY